MLCRLAATVLVGVGVMVPPVGAGLDHGNLMRSVAPEARALGSETLPSNSFAEAVLSPAAAATNPASELASEPGLAEPDPDGAEHTATGFGFGPFTSFYPSIEPRELVLSFDDGPDLKFTPLVLDELDRRGLKAIFFVTGRRVIGDHPEDLARRELLGRIAAHGHLVANHTMTHRNLCDAPQDAAAEIDENAEVIAQATGIRPLLFRAPYGAHCRTLQQELTARQLVSVGWNIDPQDWKDPTSEEILATLETRLTRLKGRGILLLHDTHPASVFALGPLLDWIARENRIAVRGGRPPIVLRDYSVFLPRRPLPRMGIATVAGAVLFDNLLTNLTSRIGSSAATALR